MRLSIIVAAVMAMALASGCTHLIENRVMTTLQLDRAVVDMRYGPIGITVQLSPEDAAEIKRLRQMAMALEAIAATQAGQQ